MKISQYHKLTLISASFFIIFLGLLWYAIYDLEDIAIPPLMVILALPIPIAIISYVSLRKIPSGSPGRWLSILVFTLSVFLALFFAFIVFVFAPAIAPFGGR